MPTPSPEVQAFWRDYLRQLPPEHHHHGMTPDAFAFGGGGRLADELAALVLAGAKRATASLAVEFSAPGEPLPQPGSVSIILAADRRPVAIIERTAVVSVPFCQVDARFAATEGEGDGSLGAWRTAHRQYFSDVCRRLGGRFDDDTPVLCQTFVMVWPPRQPIALLVIDVQRGLLSGNGAMVDADAVIDRINLVMRQARGKSVPVILIQHESDGGPLAPGSAGWQLAERLEVSPTDIRLRKTATDSFHRTALQQTLQELGVRRLVICGFQSEFCVDTTTRRALALGYPVTLVADGHSTADNGVLSAAQISAHHNVTLTGIVSFGPRARALHAGDAGLFDAASICL